MSGLELTLSNRGVFQEVRWAVMATKLLAGCELPEGHRRAFWLTVPQMMSAMEVSLGAAGCRCGSLVEVPVGFRGRAGPGVSAEPAVWTLSHALPPPPHPGRSLLKTEKHIL